MFRAIAFLLLTMQRYIVFFQTYKYNPIFFTDIFF